MEPFLIVLLLFDLQFRHSDFTFNLYLKLLHFPCDYVLLHQKCNSASSFDILD